MDFIKKKIIKHIDLVRKLDYGVIKKSADEIIRSIKKGNKILICGNGGSAADAQHMAAELVGKFKRKRKGLPAIALNTNSSVITSISNDYSFNEVFSRQIEAYARKGDILIAISTSGRSKNILKAVETAQSRKMKVIFLTGKHYKKKGINYVISVPSKDTPLIQELHIIIIHIICEMVEEFFFKK